MGAYTQDDLRATAAELGISAEALARAEAEVREERIRRAFEREQRASLQITVLTYVLVMALLVTINLMTSRGHLWFIYPLFGWGIGVAAQVISTRNRDSEHNRTAYAKFRERHESSTPASLP
jgi:hypothetical protein